MALSAPTGRVRSALVVLVYLLVVLAATLVLGLMAAFATDPTLLGHGMAASSDTEGVVSPAGLVVAVVSAIAVGLVTWLFRRFLDRRSWLDLGLRAADGTVAELGRGFALGGALIAGVAVVELGAGWYQVVGWSPPELAVPNLVVGLPLFAAVGFSEELITRGYVLQTLLPTWGRRWAVVLSALVFALLHLANPGSGPVAVLGIFAAGLMLAAGYLATGRLWLSIGLHWAWNFFQGPVFGFSVSGTGTSGLLQLSASGPELLTGGSFGPEASLVGVAACLLGAAVLLRRPTRASARS